jgi:ribosomal protein L3 glutamine methyltransferase
MPTVMQAIEDAAAQMQAAGLSFGHGTTNAFDEAVWLMLWSLKHPLHDLDSIKNQPLPGKKIEEFAILLRARIESRKPAAYLTKEAWLQGVPFYVDERVIVPRSFIAELIADESMDPWLSESTRHVLDLCTGNGSLAVLAALAWPQTQLHAADISADALAVARINVDKHHLQDRIALIESDGLAQCPGICDAQGKLQAYDLVLCNPPYVNSASMGQLPAEYRAEPGISLAGGPDGMDFIRPMLAAAAAVMSPQAVLVLEIGNERAHFERAFPRLEAVWLETSAGSDQVLLLTRNSLLHDFSHTRHAPGH